MYYKIIKDGKVLDVVSSPIFLKFLDNGTISIVDKNSAQGIAGSDGVSVYSFKQVKHKRIKAIVTIEKINEQEFSRLKDLLNSDQEVSANTSALAVAKEETIKRLSNICKARITAGFSIVLSDGLSYDFKLTTEDQLNLMVIENQIATGTDVFLYHATDQPCKFFLKEDMLRIIQAFKSYTLYHTTYFNVAKQYIKSLESIESVQQFTYGTDVSDYTDDIVIKQILKKGGNIE